MNSKTPAWRTSSYSGHEGECVEVAPLATATGVRDTKARARGHLSVDVRAWRDFLRAIKSH